MDLEHLKHMAGARAAKVEAITQAAGSDYPKFGAWLSLHCRDAMEGKRYLDQARAAGMADFAPGESAQSEPAQSHTEEAAPFAPQNRGASEAEADTSEAAVIARRIASYR